MLAKEKQFVVRSFVVGIVATGLVASYCTWRVHQADARLDALLKSPPPKSSPPIPKPPPGFVLDKPLPDAIITEAKGEAERARDNRWLLSLVTLVAFSVPLVWYFLLDRLREVSGALSGRDN
jgi:hypothetical protein